MTTEIFRLSLDDVSFSLNSHLLLWHPKWQRWVGHSDIIISRYTDRMRQKDQHLQVKIFSQNKRFTSHSTYQR